MIRSLRSEPRFPEQSQGVAAVEFIVTAPVLLLLILATAELGRAFVHYDSLSHSVRNSVRFLSENAIEGTTGVVNISGSVRDQTINLARFGNAAGSGPAMYPQFTTLGVDVVDAGNNNVEVRATYTYVPVIGAILPADVTMRVVVTMRAIS